MRYFLFQSDDETYIAIRSQLDTAIGNPNPITKTETCLPDPGECLRTVSGAILIGVDDWMCAISAVALTLPQLIDAGMVAEITAGEYRQAVDQAFREAATL